MSVKCPPAAVIKRRVGTLAKSGFISFVGISTYTSRDSLKISFERRMYSALFQKVTVPKSHGTFNAKFSESYSQ